MKYHASNLTEFYSKICSPCKKNPTNHILWLYIMLMSLSSRNIFCFIHYLILPVVKLGYFGIRHGQYHGCWCPGPCLNMKTAFPGMAFLIIKIRQSLHRLIFIMGIPILVRQSLNWYGPLVPCVARSSSAIAFTIEYAWDFVFHE